MALAVALPPQEAAVPVVVVVVALPLPLMPPQVVTAPHIRR